MKNIYTNAELEIIIFKSEDIITASAPSGIGGNGINNGNGGDVSGGANGNGNGGVIVLPDDDWNNP